MKEIKSILMVLLVLFGVVMTIGFIATSQENKELKTIIKATQDTGVKGDIFSVNLPDGRVVIGGVIMSSYEAKGYFYDRTGAYDVIMWRFGDGPGQFSEFTRRSRKLSEKQ